MTKKIRELHLAIKEAHVNQKFRYMFGNIFMIFVGLITFGVTALILSSSSTSKADDSNCPILFTGPRSMQPGTPEYWFGPLSPLCK